MAKRLHMTTADYVTIAVSPALIIALVASLVFFLIEVLYVGQYQARLNYVFGLFVFAAVLIARISIEMGAERAALFALPLGIATFLVLVRFVDHPSPLSPLINLVLIAVVWWCAHKLTWDCTLINDDEDASGQGLLERIGVDDPDEPGTSPQARSENELLAGAEEKEAGRWWQRWLRPQPGPHAPGLWVLYFSLAALPLFGLGQTWIPASDLGRRQYAFSLLLVYVAAGLSLLVTTSFLGLRRYLRQRSVDMPVPMAATWIAMGAVLILLVMMVALLVPRPHAEYAISQVPWQAGSPGGLHSSRRSFGSDAAGRQEESGPVLSAKQDAPLGSATDAQPHDESVAADQSERSDGKRTTDRRPDHARDDSSGTGESRRGGEAGSEANESDSPRRSEDAAGQAGDVRSRRSDSPGQSEGSAKNESARGSTASESANTPPDQYQDSTSPPARASRNLLAEPSSHSSPAQVLENVSSALGGLTGLLKILFYVIAALVVSYFAWKHRRALVGALLDIVHQLRLLLATLLGREVVASERSHADQEKPSTSSPRFCDFPDPFASGKHRGASPEELVRYTFDAFAAWCYERGIHRSPDQTPQELVRAAVKPQTPLDTEAQRLVRLYGEVAYAAGRIPRQSAEKLRSLWQMMRSADGQ